MEGTSLCWHQQHILTFMLHMFLKTNHVVVNKWTSFLHEFSYEKCQILDWALVKRRRAISHAPDYYSAKPWSRKYFYLIKYIWIIEDGFRAIYYIWTTISHNQSEARRRNSCSGSSLRTLVSLRFRRLFGNYYFTTIEFLSVKYKKKITYNTHMSGEYNKINLKYYLGRIRMIKLLQTSISSLKAAPFEEISISFTEERK